MMAITCSEAYDPALFMPTGIWLPSPMVSIMSNLAASASMVPRGRERPPFGQWLADRLEIPLCMKRASVLLSMYVGGTEQNLTKAFQEAERDGALLFIDALVSFLQDRRHAQRSWEVTGVNEMLTQVENFYGVFIASTNSIEGLDQASLRRFDLVAQSF